MPILKKIAGKDVYLDTTRVKKHIITLKMSAAYDFTTSFIIPFNTEIKIGDKLSKSGGTVVIGNDVSYVKISANAWVQSSTAGARPWLTLLKNGVAISGAIGTAPNNFVNLAIPPFLLNVSEGDVISAELLLDTSGSLDRGSGITPTHLTVEVVE